NSPFSTLRLFDDDYFLASLPRCGALFTFTEHVANQIRSGLVYAARRIAASGDPRGLPYIPVIVVRHPTDCTVESWSMTKFVTNPLQRLVQVGSWQRNPVALYALQNIRFVKTVLRGKHMQDMAHPENARELLQMALSGDTIPTPDQEQYCEDPTDVHGTSPSFPPPCRDPDALTWIRWIREAVKWVSQELITMEDLVKATSDVDVLDWHSDQQYDALLTKNIVFLNLESANAVNAVNDAVVRTTPLIVNRLPALEEVLGKHYPGFYDDLSGVPSKLELASIENIHKYLCALDKRFLQAEKFAGDVISVLRRLG
ncbi:hypothetical protein HDU93_006368, partial [Gonapodya sp. JEL0774]